MALVDLKKSAIEEFGTAVATFKGWDIVMTKHGFDQYHVSIDVPLDSESDAAIYLATGVCNTIEEARFFVQDEISESELSAKQTKVVANRHGVSCVTMERLVELNGLVAA